MQEEKNNLKQIKKEIGMDIKSSCHNRCLFCGEESKESFYPFCSRGHKKKMDSLWKERRKKELCLNCGEKLFTDEEKGSYICERCLKILHQSQKNIKRLEKELGYKIK